MNDLLFLSHRIPFPPDKGDKIRAWHMLERLMQTHRVHVGCFIDDPADHRYVAELRRRCTDLACFDIDPRRRRLLALMRVRPGRSLSQSYFQDARLQRWVAGKQAQGIDRAFVFCSAMAPYLTSTAARAGVLDMVDVDSEKWRAYAAKAAWPWRMLWQREARTVLKLERQAAQRFQRTLLVSQPEADCFRRLAPESCERIASMENGVDLDHFAPGQGFADPYPPGGKQIVFTGTMDYWPNIDAVTWFAREVLPELRRRGSEANFTIVGAKPTPDVLRLTDDPAVRVTGRVDDARPYIAHADAVVAPLRIARGIQNKVLEAMAMGRPVIGTPEAAEGVRATPGRDFLVADTAASTADSVASVLSGAFPKLGAAARKAMQDGYAWSATLAGIDALWPGSADRLP